MRLLFNGHLLLLNCYHLGKRDSTIRYMINMGPLKKETDRPCSMRVNCEAVQRVLVNLANKCQLSIKNSHASQKSKIVIMMYACWVFFSIDDPIFVAVVWLGWEQVPISCKIPTVFQKCWKCTNTKHESD